MGVRGWLTKKVSKVFQDAVVEPVKHDVAAATDDASEKVGLVTNLLRLAICTVIGIAMLRDSEGKDSWGDSKRDSGNSHIIINNYIEGGHGHDNGKHS